jgi:predicted metal-dependent TIM-barrel fold hydrolase
MRSTIIIVQLADDIITKKVVVSKPQDIIKHVIKIVEEKTTLTIYQKKKLVYEVVKIITEFQEDDKILISFDLTKRLNILLDSGVLREIVNLTYEDMREKKLIKPFSFCSFIYGIIWKKN